MDKSTPSRFSPLKWIAVLLIAIMVLLFAAPSLIPKSFVEKALSAKLDGKVEIDRMSLSSFSNQEFEGIRIISPTIGGTITSIEIEGKFYTLLLFPTSTVIRILQPNLAIRNGKNSSFDSGPLSSENFPKTPKIEIFNGMFQWNGALFSHLRGELQFSSTAIIGSLHTSAEIGKQSGDIRSSIQCHFNPELMRSLFDAPRDILKKLNTLKGSIQIHTDSFPLEWAPAIYPFLGNRLDSDVSIEMHDGLFISLQVKSPLLTADIGCDTEGDTLHISRRSRAQYTITDSLVKYFALPFSLLSAGELEGVMDERDIWTTNLKTALKLKNGAGTPLSVQSFSAKQNKETFTLNMQLTQPEGKGSIFINQKAVGALDFSVNKLSSNWFTLYPETAFLKQMGPVVDSKGSYLDEVLSFNIQAKQLQLSNTKLHISNNSIELLSPTELTSVFGNLSIANFVKGNGEFSFALTGSAPETSFSIDNFGALIKIDNLSLQKKSQSPLEGNFVLFFDELHGPYLSDLSPKGTVRGYIGGTLASIQINRLELLSDALKVQSGFNIENGLYAVKSNQETTFQIASKQGIQLRGTLPSYSANRAGDYKAQGDLVFEPSTLKEPSLTIEKGATHFEISKENESLLVLMKSLIDFVGPSGKQGGIEGHIQIEMRKEEIQKIDLDVIGNNLPLQLLYPEAIPFIGSYVDMEVLAKGANKADGQIKISNPFLSANLYGNLSKEGFILSKNMRKSTIEYSLEPFKQIPFLKENALKISSSGTVSLECQSLFFPFDRDTDKLELVANLQGKNLTLTNTDTEAVASFSSLGIEIDKRPLAPFVVNMDASSVYQTQKSTKSFQGTSNGRLILDPLNNESISLYLKLQNFPLLDFHRLGSVITGNAFVDVSGGLGSAGVHLLSDNIQIDGDAKVQNGILTLTSPLQGRLKDFKIKDTELQKGAWTAFTIPAKGVFLPLFPLKTSGIQIPKIFVSPFQLTTSVKGNTQALFSALNVGYKGTIPIYCVPICSENTRMSPERKPSSLSVVNGVLYLPRLDLLLENKVWIVLWGAVNLSNERATVYLGITGRTLTATLGIGQLSPYFVLPIKLEGNLKDLSVSRQDIVTAIAFLTTKIYSQMIAPGGNGINLDFLINQETVPPMTCPPSWY
ncbi:MAG: hypothetical protein ACOYK9_00580 [Chlamydiia bacterium]